LDISACVLQVIIITIKYGKIDTDCALQRGRCFLGPERNGVSSGEGGKGEPGPPDKGRHKQSNPNKEGGNMEQEEEGKKSQA
jgi:hypothetical protein